MFQPSVHPGENYVNQVKKISQVNIIRNIYKAKFYTQNQKLTSLQCVLED